MENWKVIEGYALYEISDRGNVRTIEHRDACNRLKPARIRKPRINERGYLYVTLFDPLRKKYKLMFIHRLVAEAFIPNPNNYLIINHKDSDHSNNCVANLEWCSYSYNNTYSDAIKKRNATRLRNNPNGECWQLTAKKKRKPIIQYDLDGNVVAEYDSATQAGELNEAFKRENIRLALKGRTKTAYGFIWRFK